MMQLDKKWALLGALLIILCEVLFLSTLVSPSYVERELYSERQMVAWTFGPLTERVIQAETHADFRTWFVDTGVIQTIHDMYIPSEASRQKSLGMSELGRSTSAWLEGRLQTLWLVVYAGIYRLKVFWTIFLMALVLCLPFAVDGLVLRKIRSLGFEYASPNIYHAAKGLLSLLIISPFVLVLVPSAIHPLVFITWAGLLPIVIWFGTQHVQHQI